MFSKFQKNNLSNEISFLISELDLSIINGIRRTLITHIPIVGFISEGEEEFIIISENTTPLNNEIIKNRISMIPIHLNNKETEEYDDDTDLRIELNIKNTNELIIDIKTDIFKVFKDNTELNKNQVEKLFPKNKISNDHILLTRLRKNETISFIAYPKKKTAGFHASFNSVTGCSYYYDYDISKTERDYIKNNYGEPKHIMFKFEIINGLTHKYLFDKSIEILINKFTNIKDELDNTQDYNKIESILLFAENCFDITILNEDDTIGNIFQSYIHNEYIRKKDKKIYDGLNKCIFAGYINIHPLQNKIKLRLTLEGVEKDKLETTLKKFISIICEEIIYLLLQIQKNWNNSIDLFLNL